MKSAGLKNQASAYRGGLLVTHHRISRSNPPHGTAAKGGTDEPNLLACSFEQIVW
jgi:hypothetical protein